MVAAVTEASGWTWDGGLSRKLVEALARKNNILQHSEGPGSLKLAAVHDLERGEELREWSGQKWHMTDEPDKLRGE